MDGPRSAANLARQYDFRVEIPPLSPTRSMDQAAGYRDCAARTVFLSSIAIVSGPTPPGTGVSAPATSATFGCTSPTTIEPRRLKSARRGEPGSNRRDATAGSVTGLMPTSITVAPGFTNADVTNPGRPIAATRMSA